MRCCGRGAADEVAEPVRAGAVGATGEGNRSTGSTDIYLPYGGENAGDGGQITEKGGSPVTEKPIKSTTELPPPLEELKALLERDQLPLLPGFLLEKARTAILI
jgi:hypothetical protein